MGYKEQGYPLYVTEDFNALYKGFVEIKEDLVKYLRNHFPDHKSKVVFTVRDKDVWSEDYPIWRYWVGFNAEANKDVSPLFIEQVGREYIPKLKAYWGFKGDGLFEDSTPNVFIKGKDYSGTVSSIKNWAIFHLPKKLDTNDKTSILRFHSRISSIKETYFPEVIKKFLEEITDAGNNSIKEKYRHKTSRNDRGKKAEHFYKVAHEIMIRAAESMGVGKSTLDDAVRDFYISKDLGELEQGDTMWKQREKEYNIGSLLLVQQSYYRFLNRAIDYYSIFSGFSHILSYGMVIAGYHLLTFYIMIQTEYERISQYLIFPGWKGTVDLERDVDGYKQLLKMFKKDDDDISDFSEFLGSIDGIIKSGWTNVVNRVLIEIATKGASRGYNINTTLDAALSVMLMMKNPSQTNTVKREAGKSPNSQCPFGDRCFDDEIKYFISEPYEGPGNYCAHPCFNQQGNDNATCEMLELCIDNVESSVGKYILIKLRKNKFSDPTSSLIIIEGMIRSFVKYYNEMVIPIRNEMIKAVVAEIMNRNYAHHIGSHISLRATFDKIMHRMGWRIDEVDRHHVAGIAQMIIRLDQYKNERNEFIAGLNNMEIYHTSYFYRDIILPLLENTLFMDNIAKNEGICYKNNDNSDLNDDIINDKSSQSRLKIKIELMRQGESIPRQVFAKYNKGKDQYCTSDNIPYYNAVEDIDNYFYDSKEVVNDFAISVPGTLGRQCIYSILENHIRNTAKHSYIPKEHSEKEIEIALTIKENREYYEVELTDNISDGHKCDALKGKIGRSILERSNLGFSDMKINTCLLAGLPLNDYNLTKCLSVFEKEGRICYGFKLLKPKEIALIGGEWKSDVKDESSGVFYYRDFREYVNKCEIKNFRFAIIDSFVTIEELKTYHNKLPYRIIVLCKSGEVGVKNTQINNSIEAEESHFKGASNIRDIISLCWEAWLRKYSQSNIEMILYFEQKETEEPTLTWKNIIPKSRGKDKGTFDVWHDNISGDVKNGRELLEQDKYSIIYDRHSRILHKLKKRVLKANFYEMIDKNNIDFQSLFNERGSDCKNYFAKELIEAGLLKVLVLDERAAEAAPGLLSDSGGNYCQLYKKGFRQYDGSQDGEAIQRFDACWAAGIYIATDIQYSDDSEYQPLFKTINPKVHHYLKIKFLNKDGNISILGSTNFMEWEDSIEWNNAKELWLNKNEVVNEMQKQQEQELQIDILIIHRTVLKKIIENEQWRERDFVGRLKVSRVIIVTGGGVVDFISEEDRPKILASDILHKYIIGARPAKYNLMKIITS